MHEVKRNFQKVMLGTGSSQTLYVGPLTERFPMAPCDPINLLQIVSFTKAYPPHSRAPKVLVSPSHYQITGFLVVLSWDMNRSSEPQIQHPGTCGAPLHLML